MIIIHTLEVAGIGPAIHAMRNPMDSWGKSDSHQGRIGKKDFDLSVRLTNAGTEHAKHLRMCMVWVEILAPLFWWKEFDTYRVGVEKLSCSTMHTLCKQPITADLFTPETDRGIIQHLETLRGLYLVEQDPERKKAYWRQIIATLPSSFIQRRTVMISYAALRNICKQREGHKLEEWEHFREWCLALPEAWMIRDDAEEFTEEEPEDEL